MKTLSGQVDADGLHQALLEAWYRADRAVQGVFDDRPSGLFPWVMLGADQLPSVRPDDGVQQLDLFGVAA